MTERLDRKQVTDQKASIAKSNPGIASEEKLSYDKSSIQPQPNPCNSFYIIDKVVRQPKYIVMHSADEFISDDDQLVSAFSAEGNGNSNVDADILCDMEW